MQEKEYAAKDLSGESYIETRDEYGNVVQYSYPKHSSYLGDYYETYDKNRQYIGFSRIKKDTPGERVIETYDRNNQLLSTSYERYGMYGKVYWEIVDSHGQTIGTKTGNTTNYTNAYQEQKEIEDRSEDSESSSGDSSESRPKSLPGGNIGMIGALVIAFLAGMLALMLHDDEGRETIHRVVTPMIGIIPIGIILLRFLKLKDIVDRFKWKALILSIGLMLVMQGYYIWFTSKSMAWVIDNDLAYYALWLLPYGFLFLYAFVLGKMSVAAKKMMSSRNLDKILEVIFPTTIFAFCFCPALMILRWEYYSESVKQLKLVVEFIVFLVVCAVGLGAAMLAAKIFESVFPSTKKSR